jgi:hypothetical protein
MKFSSQTAAKAAFCCPIYPCRGLGPSVAQPSAIRHSRRQVVDSDAEAAVFAGDRELQAVMRELDAALDMVEELPQQA